MLYLRFQLSSWEPCFHPSALVFQPQRMNLLVGRKGIRSKFISEFVWTFELENNYFIRNEICAYSNRPVTLKYNFIIIYNLELIMYSCCQNASMVFLKPWHVLNRNFVSIYGYESNSVVRHLTESEVDRMDSSPPSISRINLPKACLPNSYWPKPVHRRLIPESVDRNQLVESSFPNPFTAITPQRHTWICPSSML